MDRIGTVALVIRREAGDLVYLDALSDDQEIKLLEDAISKGTPDPLHVIYELRERQSREDEEFGDYVENLVASPFCRTDIRDHGLQWFRSKMRIEEFQRTESEATAVIATFAYNLFRMDQSKKDFTLQGAKGSVHIRVLEVVANRDKKVA